MYLKQTFEPLSNARITGTPIPLGKDVDLTALATRIIYPSTGVMKQQEVKFSCTLKSCCGGTGHAYILIDEFLSFSFSTWTCICVNWPSLAIL